MSNLIRISSVLLCLMLQAYRSPAQALETGPVGVYANTQNGTRTALGIIYQENQLTCAHKFHASGSYLRVTRIDNGLSTVVQVIDRLSARADEVVRIAKAAADLLQIDPNRIAIVQIEKIGEPAAQRQVYYNTSPRSVQSYDAPAYRPTNVPQSYDASPNAASSIADRAPKFSLPSNLNPNPEVAPPTAYDHAGADRFTPRSPAAGTLTRRIPQNYETSTPRTSVIPPTYSVPPPSGGALADRAPKLALPNAFSGLTARGGAADRPAAYESAGANPALRYAGAYYVQVAAFSDYANAERHYQDLNRRGIANANILQASKGDGKVIYRTWIGPFSNAAAAKTQKEWLAKEYRLNGLVVREEE